MKNNPLRELAMLGQSIWLDYIRRTLIVGGGLRAIDRGGWAARDDLESSHL